MSNEPVHRIGTDPDAFETFYREHVATVQRFVARRVDTAEVAADLTADIFVAAIDASHTYRSDRGAPIAWLYGIARNVVAAEHRRRGRELGAVRRIAGRRLLDEESTARIVERLDAERETRRLYMAIAALPERQRVLLELVAVDGLSVADAARSIGIKPATARVQLHRTRTAIHTQLRPALDAVLITEEAR